MKLEELLTSLKQLTTILKHFFNFKMDEKLFPYKSSPPPTTFFFNLVDLMMGYTKRYNYFFFSSSISLDSKFSKFLMSWATVLGGKEFFPLQLEFAGNMCSMYGSKQNSILFSVWQGLASTFIYRSSRKNFAMHFHTAGDCKLCCFPIRVYSSNTFLWKPTYDFFMYAM